MSASSTQTRLGWSSTHERISVSAGKFAYRISPSNRRWNAFMGCCPRAAGILTAVVSTGGSTGSSWQAELQ